MGKRTVIALTLMSALTWQKCDYEVVPGPVDCNENPVTITSVSSTEAECALMDGTISVEASGGDGSYHYILGDGKPQEAPLFEGIGAGVYTVTVVDGNTCSASMEVSVTNIDGLNITFETTEAGGCAESDGMLNVTAFNGVEPYQYRINEGSYSSGHEFTGLAKGVYNLTVSDASGCEVTQPVRIKSGISFAASIRPIIENSCAISDCHNGSQYPDFRVFKNIHDNAAQIKALTADRTMPQDGSITQTEINMIACWVDDGAPGN